MSQSKIVSFQSNWLQMDFCLVFKLETSFFQRETNNFLFKATLSHKNYLWVKLRHYEKATKLEKKSHLIWQNRFCYSVASKQVGGLFKFRGLLRKAELYKTQIHIYKYISCWTANSIQIKRVTLVQLYFQPF